VTDLYRLPPAKARELLALAGMAVVARAERLRDVEMIRLEGSEINEETLRATAHRILVEKRRARGMDDHVDFTFLSEGGDQRR
jgi:hypothetical protein